MKQFINTILQNRLLSHVLFWLVLLLLYTVSKGVQSGPYLHILNHNAIMLIPQILASYCLIYLQFPKLLYKGKYILFFLSFILGCYLFSALARVMVVHIIEELYREPPFIQESVYEILTDIRKLYKHFFYSVFLPVFLVAAIKLIKERFEEKNRLEILKKEKITAELNFMRAQIHPHFLFNTLNNLYVLTLQKSDNAADVVLKLSEMLDYMLYKCNEDTVSISEEIQLIQNYIDLEQLRYGDRLELILNKDIDNPQTQIAPLILVSLIENAFKHGASGAVTIPKIKIDISIKNEQLLFSIYNTKPAEVQKDDTSFKSGIGLVNTKSQLQLIYPESHSIEVIEDITSYTVKLQINLKD